MQTEFATQKINLVIKTYTFFYLKSRFKETVGIDYPQYLRKAIYHLHNYFQKIDLYDND